MNNKAPKLLLVNPWIYDFAAFDHWAQPVGLLYIGSILRSLGYHINYIDCMNKFYSDEMPKLRKYGNGHYHRTIVEKPSVLKNIPRNYARYGVPEDIIIEMLDKYTDSDAIFITSMMTYWYPGVECIVKLIRKHIPGKPVILGGIYASILPSHAKEVIKPDFLVTGPGENKVLEILRELFDYVPQNEVPQSFNEYPYPAFDLQSKISYLPIMTSRGCMYNCDFCAQKLISPHFTQRKYENVLEEILFWHKNHKIIDFIFYDDALFAAREKLIKPLLAEIIKLELPIRFHTPNGLFAGLIDKELALLMYKSNFKTIRLSFETSNEKRRKQMSLKVTNQDFVNAVSNLKEAGYKDGKIDSYIMMGLPDQDYEEIMESIDFVHVYGVIVKLASYTPIPGTKNFKESVNKGLITPDIDPLLTNNSIYPFSRDKNPALCTPTYEEFNQIRLYAKSKNNLLK